MSLGQKLLELRKQARLSQEEVAEKLSVTRQTISKWETDQSVPDFDRIAPLCELYHISADELLTGKTSEKNVANVLRDDSIEQEESNKNKRALGIGIGVVLYFVAVAWIMVSVSVMKMNPIVASAIFLVICGLATFSIVYVSIVCKKTKKKEDETQNKVVKQIDSILSLVTLVIYMAVSFITMAWAITWLIWIIYAIVMEIVKLVFMLRGEESGK